MRKEIKMELLKDARGIGKAGKEFEVSTAEQADYFENAGIAKRKERSSKAPDSSSSVSETPQPSQEQQPDGAVETEAAASKTSTSKTTRKKA